MTDPPGERGTIVVIGACGGCGASLVASGLALWWARAGVPVWLIELDLERGDLGGAWDLPPARTLGDLAAVVDEIDGAQLRRAAHQHASGVRLLLAPATPEPSEAWTATALARLVDAARSDGGPGGRAVVDAGPGWVLAAGLAAEGRASLIVACPPTLAGARRARRLIGLLARSGADARCALVVNNGPDRGELGARALGRAVGAPVLAEIPWVGREAAEMGAGRWPRGRRARLAGAVEQLARAAS